MIDLASKTILKKPGGLRLTSSAVFPAARLIRGNKKIEEFITR
jgi:hypothetical protein